MEKSQNSNAQDEVEMKVMAVLANEMGFNETSISLDARLVEDLHIDSDDLSFVFIPTLVEYFKVKIPAQGWRSCFTGRDAANLIKKYLQAKP
jgi:acyl carrier protein